MSARGRGDDITTVAGLAEQGPQAAVLCLCFSPAMRRRHKHRPTPATNLRQNDAVHSGKPGLWLALALFVATLGFYAQVRDYEFVNYDDPAYVTDNIHVRSGLTRESVAWAFSTGYESNWFPLTWLSHMLDCQLFGLKSGLHHLTSVLLHAFSAVLLFALLHRLTRALWRSLFVAFVFALHPLHVESVAWIAERKDVLGALFWVVTLWTYLNYTKHRSFGRYLVVILALCCGLMSKPMIVTLPFVALLLDWWPLRRFAVRGVILEKIPLLALSIAGSIVTYVVQRHGGSVVSIAQIPIAARAGNALASYAVYAGKIFWPANLAVFYPYSTEGILWKGLAAGAVLAGITALVLREMSRRPYLAVGWLWYLGTLVPVIGLIQVGAQARADRYTYIPMIGISLILAWGMAEACERWPNGRRALAILSITVCLGWAVATWLNIRYWQNSLTLFQHAIEVTDDNYIAYNNLGVALRQAGEFAEAIANFERAVSIRPEEAEAQDNLGEALLAAGRTSEATPHIEAALRVRPGFMKAHIDLGSAMIGEGRVEEAASQYRLAIQLQPESDEAHYGLGGVLMEQGRKEEALPHLRRALPHLIEAVRTNPEDADAHYNLGRVFGILGEPDRAIAQFGDTVRLRPGDAEAHFNLGIALAARARLNEARDEFAAAVRLRPDYVKAHLNLGGILGSLGEYDEAVREFSEALRLEPDSIEARDNLSSYKSRRPR
ncbi:Tetratricopeptide TPR_2 repeat protein [Candidatus Sulfopaludibacter sp. SbA6]|nr:Tetratricopeptide TPR_2 repeat protein [Candidatus Sulfopaludibacter sp. SbA6]